MSEISLLEQCYKLKLSGIKLLTLKHQSQTVYVCKVDNMEYSRGIAKLQSYTLVLLLQLSAVCFTMSSVSEASTDPLTCQPEQTPPNTCPEVSLCGQRKFSLEEPIYYNFARYNCRCDDACHVYGDCCVDKEQLQGDRPEDGTMTCEKVPLENSFGLNTYLVTKCPSNFRGNDSVRRKCEHSKDTEDMLQQWIVSDDSGLVYVNVYCAFCHGVEDPAFWVLNMSCSKDLSKITEGVESNETGLNILDRALKDPSCELVYSHPTMKFGSRYCKPMISSCSSDWTQDCIRKQCEHKQGSLSQVFDLSALNIYTNPYCAICNNLTDYTCRDFITSQVLLMYVTQQNKRGFLPISVLFDIKTGGMTGIRNPKHPRDDSEVFQQEVKSCPDKQVYNPSKGICVDIVCGPGYKYISGFCTKTVDSKADLIPELVTGCTYIMLTPSEFIINATINNSIVLQSKEQTAGKIYLNTEFLVLENGSALVCTNYSRNFTIRVGSTTTEGVNFNFDNSQAILSLVGQVLSIIALTFQLVVYAILPPLRNLAGKNLMCLSASLLIAQITFLAGISRTEIYGLCVFMAVLIHYSYLASFFWMNIMSFDIWRTFSRNSVAHAESGHVRQFRRYSIYGWGSPCVFVVIAIIMDFSLAPHNPNRPAYGEYMCWITNRNALLIFFAVPIALIIISNTVFYIVTIYNIHQVQRSTRIITTNNQKSNTCQFLLYIKLCTIMGLTWVFAFIAMLGKLPVLWYVFIVFNSLQGVIICLTFVLTAKVLRLLSEKMRKLCSENIYHVVSRDDDDRSRRTSKFSLSHTISHDATRQDQVVLRQVSRDVNNIGRK